MVANFCNRTVADKIGLIYYPKSAIIRFRQLFYGCINIRFYCSYASLKMFLQAIIICWMYITKVLIAQSNKCEMGIQLNCMMQYVRVDSVFVWADVGKKMRGCSIRIVG